MVTAAFKASGARPTVPAPAAGYAGERVPACTNARGKKLVRARGRHLREGGFTV